MRHLLLVIATLLIASCDVGRRGDRSPPPERFEHDTMVRLHMHANFDLSRAIERLVIRGKLDDVKSLARAITVAPDEPGLPTFAIQTRKVRDLASALADSPSTDEACRRQARLSVGCAECHAAAGVVPALTHTPPLPADEPTLEARMARHRWAADRLWEATIGGGVEPWLEGLDVLAQTPFPFRMSLENREGLARRLQQLADEGRKLKSADTLAERGRIYGEILVVCASCHATSSTR